MPAFNYDSFGLTILLDYLWILISVAMIAGLVRGYAGFGFAALAVVGFNLILSPQQSVPIILGLDVLCSAGLWRQALKQADISTFKTLTLGALVGIPIGLCFLIFIPEDILKVMICIAILVFSFLLMFDFRLKNANSKKVKFGYGLSSGIGTAGASVGGPMIVCYMLSSALTPAAQRATMILFFIVSETVAVGAIVAGGLVGTSGLTLLGILLVPTLIAVRVGQWLFNRHPPQSLKHFALPILMMVAVLGISASVGALI